MNLADILGRSPQNCIDGHERDERGNQTAYLRRMESVDWLTASVLGEAAIWPIGVQPPRADLYQIPLYAWAAWRRMTRDEWYAFCRSPELQREAEAIWRLDGYGPDL